MAKRFDIPFEWQQQSHNFISYHGDIYPGNIVFCPHYTDGFFIVPNINMKSLERLPKDQKTRENYAKAGWEINDVRVISQFPPIPQTTEIGSDTGVNGELRNANERCRKLFVFGAGASAFCCFGESEKSFKNYDLKPPLGNEIFSTKFDSTLNQFPGAQESISLFESSNWDIEGIMQKEWEMARVSFNPNITSRHINLQFYFSELFKLISNGVTSQFNRGNLYSLFALKLQSFLADKNNIEERVGIVSFNYDTILDTYLERTFRHKYSDIDSYVTRSKNILLFKAHGSCNWGWEFQQGKLPTPYQSQIATHLYNEQTLPAQIYYNYLGDLRTNVHSRGWAIEKQTNPKGLGRYTINKDNIRVFSNPLDGFFPALLMPYKEKDEFVMPYSHTRELRYNLDQVEELYLIGWKGNEDSFNSFVNDHAQNIKKIVIVNPNPEEVKSYIGKYLPLEKMNEIITFESFEKFVREGMDQLALYGLRAN